MATVYKIKIEMVSAWVNYSEDYILQMFDKFLKNENKFENTEIEVERDGILVKLNKANVTRSTKTDDEQEIIDAYMKEAKKYYPKKKQIRF